MYALQVNDRRAVNRVFDGLQSRGWRSELTALERSLREWRMDELRQIVSKPTPSRMTEFSPVDYQEISCDRCGHLPDPETYFVCDNCTVHICKHCASPRYVKEKQMTQPEESGQEAAGNAKANRTETETSQPQEDSGARSKRLICSCAANQLRKGPAKFLELVLKFKPVDVDAVRMDQTN